MLILLWGWISWIYTFLTFIIFGKLLLPLFIYYYTPSFSLLEGLQLYTYLVFWSCIHFSPSNFFSVFEVGKFLLMSLKSFYYSSLTLYCYLQTVIKLNENCKFQLLYFFQIKNFLFVLFYKILFLCLYLYSRK